MIFWNWFIYFEPNYRKQNMRRTICSTTILIVFICFFSVSGKTQNISSTSDIFYYKKNERNLGFRLLSNETRNEIRTDKTVDFEELTNTSTTFLIERNMWNFLDYKQEQFYFNFEFGPALGWGNFVDSSFVEDITADHKITGITTKANIGYTNRYYWDRRNYTIMDVSAWGHYNYYKQSSEGTRIDSNQVSTPYDISENKDKLHYGFQAKAGWGIGRLNPMNNYMLADYLLNKYYPDRNFSEEEIINVADEIGRIKLQRNIKTRNDLHKEAGQLSKYISENMLLTVPENLKNEWQLSEFLPRFSGNRIEAGPFFNYFNREPDFVYGGYFKYENQKYRNINWNRNFSAGINYNGYKKRDWIMAEVDFGWSYYPNLKNQWDFGVKYIPGIVVNGFEEIEPVVHNFIPYFGFYSQINSALRMQADASFRINNDEQFMLSGPEFSLKFFWSRY